jgi:hypothetical protein
LAEPAFKTVLAVIVPPRRLVLAIMLAILADEASIPPITLAAPVFNWVLAVIVPPSRLVLAIISFILE